MAHDIAAPAADAAGERERVSEDVRRLAVELRPRDPANAALLDRLASAVAAGKTDEARGYLGAIDPRAIAELIARPHSAIWGWLEVMRNVLVFAPIAVTWAGLSAASAAYAVLINQRPELIDRPFLLLWQEGFYGALSMFTFSTLALTDSALIGLLIVLSLLIHVRAELRDNATRMRLLLRESEIRGLLGHAIGVASASELGTTEAEGVLDEMVAEERRIYERALEREQQLFDLEGAVAELRDAAGKLARAAESLTDRAADSEPEQRARIGRR